MVLYHLLLKLCPNRQGDPDAQFWQYFNKEGRRRVCTATMYQSRKAIIDVFTQAIIDVFTSICNRKKGPKTLQRMLTGQLGRGFAPTPTNPGWQGAFADLISKESPRHWAGGQLLHLNRFAKAARL